MTNDLTDNDRQRIEQASLLYSGNHNLSSHLFNGFIKGAEYATLYERQQQIKTLNRPGFKYYVSYDPDYKDKVFGVFNKEDLTQQGAEKMAQQLNELEAERSELVNENERLTGLLKEVEPLLFLNDGIRMRIKEVLNSLKK